jgi:hypothetical protein
VARLTREESENFIGLLEAMGEGDGARAAQHVLAFSKHQPCQGDAAVHFVAEVEEASPIPFLSGGRRKQS